MDTSTAHTALLEPKTHAAQTQPAPTHTVRAATETMIDVVIPVYNEEADIEGAVRRVHQHLMDTHGPTFRVTVADNASTDGTLQIARNLAAEMPEVHAFHLEQKGRGRALKAVWSASPAEVLVYMDVDLSTDLNALGPLVAPLISGHSDLAIGTRLSRSSRVSRGMKREVISRSYNLLLRGGLGAHFSDAQCGFKAIRADVAQQLLPLVKDTAWFFDTELLVLAEHAGLRVAEVPVDWTDDPNSSVDILKTAADDLKGMWRISRDLTAGRIPLAEVRARMGRTAPTGSSGALLTQMARFAVVGAASTAAYALIYLAARQLMDQQAANFLALLITAVANTAANRAFTFGVRGSDGAARHHLQGLLVFGLGWALTAISLAAVNTGGTPSHGLEVAVLTAANLAATLLRFLLMRRWVFRPTASL